MKYPVYSIKALVVDEIPIFNSNAYCSILTNALNHYIVNDGLQVYAYCFINEFAFLLINQPDKREMSIVQNWKKFTSRQCAEKIKKELPNKRDWLLHRLVWNADAKATEDSRKFWKHGNSPQLILNNQDLVAEISRIENIPVEIGIVIEASHWRFSSASDRLSTNPIINLAAL